MSAISDARTIADGGGLIGPEHLRVALAEAFESGARSYAASDPCCGTYHLHEIENPHTGEAIPTREGEDDL